MRRQVLDLAAILLVQEVQGGQVSRQIGGILRGVARVHLDQGRIDAAANLFGQYRIEPDMGIAAGVMVLLTLMGLTFFLVRLRFM